MTTKEDERFKQSVLDQFYSKKYKVKPFARFTILTDPNQSQTQIPSTSSYLRAKNAKEELKLQFQQDLSQLKRLQSDKNFKKFAGKLYGNSSYQEERVVKEPQRKIVTAAAPQEEVSAITRKREVDRNAFLKK